MEETVNTAVETAATAGNASEPAPAFEFPSVPTKAPEKGSESKPGEQKDAGAVDAQRSADQRGKEPRNDGTRSFQRQPPQKEIGDAFRKESQRIQRDFDKKMQADPYRNAGMRLVRDIMRSKGITEEQALQELDNSFYAAIAEREGISPGIARLLYVNERAGNATQLGKGSEEPGETEPNATPSDAQEDARAIVSELQTMQMPEGFDLKAAAGDQAFIELLVNYAPAAAVRIYAAEQRAQAAATEAEQAPQRVADQLRSRAAIPQSTRASASGAEPDFRKMTDNEFRKYQREHRRE